MKNKHPWTRAEKSLVFAPILMLLASGGVWWWQKTRGVFIPILDAEQMAFSPDGRLLAVLTRPTNRVYTNQATFFDARTGNLEGRLKTASTLINIGGMAWSPDGKRLATGYTTFAKGPVAYKYQGKIDHNTIHNVALWDVPSGLRSGFFPYASPDEVMWSRVFWAPDGRLWGTGSPPALFDVQRGTRKRRFGPATTLWGPMGILNVNQTLVSLSVYERKVASVYETKTGRLVRTIPNCSWGAASWSREPDILLVQRRSPDKVGRLNQSNPQLLNVRTGRVLLTPSVRIGLTW